jgi:hypothetical protein
MIFPSDFQKMQTHFPDFLEYLCQMYDYCRTENCRKQLETCCSLRPLLSILEMGTTCFQMHDDLEQLNPDGPQML